MTSSVSLFAYFETQISPELMQIFANGKQHFFLSRNSIEKFHCLKSEFHVKFHAKNQYCTNREAISVFQVEFNMEFTCQAVNFS